MISLKDAMKLAEEIKKEVSVEDETLKVYKVLLEVYKGMTPKVPFNYKDDTLGTGDTATKRVLIKLGFRPPIKADQYTQINKLRSWYNGDEEL